MTNTRHRIGQRIRQLRQEAGLSHDQLGELTGMRRQNLIRIEQGKYSTGIDILAKIAEALGKEIDIVDKKGNTND